MASSAQDLVGLAAFSREGDKIGKIKGVVSDCLVIKHSIFRDLVVPADVVERQDDTVTVPFSSSYLDVAPRVAAKGELSSEETSRLERFFHPTAV
jgi:ribosomal 30S subunit maturation factor RimM